MHCKPDSESLPMTEATLEILKTKTFSAFFSREKFLPTIVLLKIENGFPLLVGWREKTIGFSTNWHPPLSH